MKYTLFTCFLILLGFTANAQHGKPDTICSLSEGGFKIHIVFDSILQKNQIKTWCNEVVDSANTTLYSETIKCLD